MSQLQRRWFVGASALLLAACTDSTAPAPPAAVKLAFTVQPSNATSESAVEGEDDHSDSDGIQRSIVCFSVKNGTDVNSSSVTGTLFHRGRYTSASKVILLNHGTASNRGVWDGGPAGAASPQVARLLASVGYVVITYDRLGHGESVYSGDPRTLTQLHSVFMMHQVITQIRTGTFTRTRVPEGDQPASVCPTGIQARFGMPTVIIGGHSSGGAQVMNYATRYHDIAAVIAFNSRPDAPPTAGATDLFRRVVNPQVAANLPYIYLFGAGPSGISTDCLERLFYQPGADAEVYNKFCANQNRGQAPFGDITTGVGGDALARIGQHLMGSTPLMLLMSDQEPFHGFQDIRDWQATFFRQNANTTTLIQSNAGHASMLHRSAPQAVAGIVDWLASKGLAPADPRHDEDRDDQGDDHDDGISTPDFDLN
jgi:pimeloyl-ACP methyl ester carboxylesterase